MDHTRRTKIVATLGPASEPPEVLRELLLAGVDVVRLNFSHGTLEEKARVIDDVRSIASEIGRPVAILADLQGPKIRVGLMQGGAVHLAGGSIVAIHSDEREGTAEAFSTSLEALDTIVHVGAPIYLDDGRLELRVVSMADGIVYAEVVKGGALSSHKGVNLPGVPLPIACLTEKDEEDLRFALAHGVDMVALSFVREASDADAVRAIMKETGENPLLIAKIEKQEALTHLDAILRSFDSVMVARGDLGVELKPEMVPPAQKRIIRRARARGRPVITATEMLESMTVNPRPTRAEASDVANAVLDGTDAVMLSGETAVGAYPVETVQAMDRIIREAERIPSQSPPVATRAESDTQAVCEAAAVLAIDMKAAALTALTRSGRTAQTLSSLRPRVPIFAFLWEDERLARRLNLWHGVVPHVVHGELNGADVTERIEQELTSRNILEEGACVIVVGAAPGGPAGRTNLIRVLRL